MKRKWDIMKLWHTKKYMLIIYFIPKCITWTEKKKNKDEYLQNNAAYWFEFIELKGLRFRTYWNGIKSSTTVYRHPALQKYNHTHAFIHSQYKYMQWHIHAVIDTWTWHSSRNDKNSSYSIWLRPSYCVVCCVWFTDCSIVSEFSVSNSDFEYDL